MGEVFSATLRDMKRENSQRLDAVILSLRSLKNQEGWYAEDHRKIISIREKFKTILEEQTIKPAE